jgi:hypothetical protein
MMQYSFLLKKEREESMKRIDMWLQAARANQVLTMSISNAMTTRAITVGTLKNG